MVIVLPSPGTLRTFAAGATLIWVGLCYLASTGQLSLSPTVTSLRLVDWYRATVSAGRDRCPTGRAHGADHSCSAYGRRVLDRYGFLIGWSLALYRMHRCALYAQQHDDAGDCCVGLSQVLCCEGQR